MQSSVLTVTQLNTYLKFLLEGDERLRCVYVTGEISNFKDHYPSGHLYFSLKDEKCTVRAVMFAQAARRLRFSPRNGMKILARGRLAVYEVTGQYQLYVDDMQPAGVGAKAVAREQLKEKLLKEGLFDQARKKPLPRYPKAIGIVTSPTGAAVHDMLNILHRRWPAADVYFYPVAVQGEQAPEELAAALDALNADGKVDVILFGRGGGSAEDLSAFDEEMGVRAVARSKIPVISAVGHETDVALTDFDADLRAPTPSAAAELAVPDAQALLQQLEEMKERLRTSLQRTLTDSHMQLALLEQSLRHAGQAPFTRRRQAFERLCGRLEDLNPLRVLARGYAWAKTEDGATLTDEKQVKTRDAVAVQLSRGVLHCRVLQKEAAE